MTTILLLPYSFLETALCVSFSIFPIWSFDGLQWLNVEKVGIKENKRKEIKSLQSPVMGKYSLRKS